MKKSLSAQCFLLIFILLFYCLFVIGCTSQINVIPDDASYCVIYSDMLSEKGGYFFVDEKGKHTGSTNLFSMQDLSFFDVNDNRIILSGGRKNNSLIISEGTAEFNPNFIFLNNSNYSGVTAIKLRESDILGIMNGNFSGKTYLNLLVLQALGGEVLQQTILEIYARDILDIGDCAVITGRYLDETAETKWCAEIIVCQLGGGDEFYQYTYEEYNCFWRIIQYRDTYLCLAEDKNEKINTIVSVDPDTFEIYDRIIIDDQLNSFITFGDEVFVIGDLGLYEIDFEHQRFYRTVSFDKIVQPEGYVYFGYKLEDSAYVFIRNSQRKLNGNMYEYGHILKIDLISRDISETIITYNKSESMDTIFIIPTEFISKK